jgi:phosphoribosyl 1,2-cyclic phosphodiesterase
MKLTVLNSGSVGNCYILEGKTASLIIEAGVSFKKVKPVIDFKISRVNGVIVSHSHGDHSKFIGEYLSYSIPVYLSPETMSETGLVHHNFVPIMPLSKVSVGEFMIMPFELKHDVKCYGYLIKHSEMGTMLFATDTYYIPNTFLLQILITFQIHLKD